MANVIPGTKFAEGAPPGSTGQTTWHAPPQGGGQEIARGVERMGGTIAAYALNTIRQEQVLEVSEKQRKIDELGWTAHNSVVGDEEADGKLWEKFQTDANLIASSSKWEDVNEENAKYVNSVSPNWQQGIYSASLTKRREIAKDAFNLGYSTFLENDNKPEANKLLDNALSLQIVTRPEYDNLKETQEGDSHLLKMERLVALGLPNEALAESEALSKMDLTTDQLHKKAIINTQLKKLQEGKEAEVLDKAFDFAVTGDFVSGMDIIKGARKDLGVDSFIDVLNKYQNAVTILNKNGINVYKETQNWELYWDDYQKAIDGQISERDSRSHVGVNGYSVAQFKDIKSILDGTGSKAKAFEDSAAAQNLMDIIAVDYPKKDEPEMYQFAAQRYLGILQDWIVNNPDATDREKKEQALRIGRQFNREDTKGILGAELKSIFRPPKARTLPEGTPAGRINGKSWGVHNGDGTVTLNAHGVQLILNKFNNDAEKGIEFAKMRGYIIPE